MESLTYMECDRCGAVWRGFTDSSLVRCRVCGLPGARPNAWLERPRRGDLTKLTDVEFVSGRAFLLGVEAHTSAINTGDRDVYEEDEWNDLEMLADDYWDAGVRAELEDAARQRDLELSLELIQWARRCYEAGWFDGG